MKAAQPGLRYRGQVWPKPSDLASAIGNAGVDVVSSPTTIGYLEFAALYAVEHLFEQGETSVGTGFDLKHLGAASPDRPVDVSSELVEVDGIRLTFEVEARQGGKVIMAGRHQRAVVNLERLLSGAKTGQPQGGPVVLTGRALTPQDVETVAQGRKVELAPETAAPMQRGRAVVERYFDEGLPAYGLTTGLGMRVTELLSRDEAAAFSYQTVRGRAQAVGEPLSVAEVRAAMLVRLNTLLTGETGASPHVAQALAAALNAGFTPMMPRTGSIGAGDLVVMAGMAHALIGEGEAFVEGERLPAAEALRKAGLKPLELGPKDGLALCNNPSHSVASAALALAKARRVLDAANVAAALSMEGFRANLSPLAPAANRARPQPGQMETAALLMRLFEGSGLHEPGAARRLQDPISIRSVAQIHGSVLAALQVLDQAVTVELNACPDNPLVVIDEDRVISAGNYHTPWLTQALDTASRALAQAANDLVSRIQRLCTPDMSGLPPLLSSASSNRAGFGPLLKPLEALRAEVLHLANPVPVVASFNANGVEDAATLSPLAARKLDRLCETISYLVAYELVAGAQAVDLSRPAGLAARLAKAQRLVRQHSAFMDEDRPIGREVEVVACELVLMGGLADVYR
jgi:histidine ammonia-lyase